MKKILIIGGTGQLGLILSKHLIRKNKKIIITSRYKKNIIKKKNFEITQLDIFNKREIKNLIEKYNPESIFYFAGQSSPKISFLKKNQTIKSNFLGCKNFLEVIINNDKNIKFFNAASCEMYGNIKGKIKVNSIKKPVSPYGIAKLKSFQLTKFYRTQKNLKAYNIIFFNTESIFRKRYYLIPKICFAAINAKKYGKITSFGNLKIEREWNWGDDQCKMLLRFYKKKPQDFILSNGKKYSIKEMLNFAFNYFKLDYKKYVKIDKKLFRKNEVINKKSDYQNCLKRNGIKKFNFIFGKQLISLMILHYLKKYK